MNGNFYQNPTFPNNATPINLEQVPTPNIPIVNQNIKEKYYINNILFINKGKRVNLYTSNKTFYGIIEDIGEDYIILSDPETGKWYLIKDNIIDYIEFIEHINHN